MMSKSRDEKQEDGFDHSASPASLVLHHSPHYTSLSMLQYCRTILAVVMETNFYDIEEENSDLIRKMSWEVLGVFLVELDIEMSMCLFKEEGAFSLICNKLFNSKMSYLAEEDKLNFRCTCPKVDSKAFKLESELYIIESSHCPQLVCHC